MAPAPLPLSLRVLRVLAKKPASVPTIARETGALEGDVKRELDKHLTAGRAEVSGSSWALTKSGLPFTRKMAKQPSKMAKQPSKTAKEPSKQAVPNASMDGLGVVEAIAWEAAKGAVKLTVDAVARFAVKEAEKTTARLRRQRRAPKRGEITAPDEPSPAVLAIKMQLVERGLWSIVEDVARKHGEDPLSLIGSQWSRNKVIARSEMFARVLVFEGRRYSIPEVAQMFGRDESVVRDGIRRWKHMQETVEAA